MSNEGLWSEEELKASVEAYAEMYRADQAARRVNKAQMYRDLEERFDRANKAFERRMQNISHVVTLLGGQYVKGLKPLSHIGANTQPVLERLVIESGFLEREDTIQANTTLPLRLEEADKRVSRLHNEWNKSGKTVLPPNGFIKAEEYESKTIQRKRCLEVKVWVLHNSNGVCESCGADAPFSKEDNIPYLEVHHVVNLADDGPDTTENAVAVCPNCHRALHLADNKGQLIENLYTSVKRLRRP